MCPDCNGLGTRLEVDPDLIVGDPTISLLDGALRFFGNMRKKRGSWLTGKLDTLAEHYGVALEQPWQDLPQRFRDAILYGSGDEEDALHLEQREVKTVPGRVRLFVPSGRWCTRSTGSSGRPSRRGRATTTPRS